MLGSRFIKSSHSQKLTVAARVITPRKIFGHLWTHPPVIEGAEGVFDPVLRLVQVFVEVCHRVSIAATGNAGLNSQHFEIVSGPVGVVTAVSYKKLDGRHAIEQFT